MFDFTQLHQPDMVIPLMVKLVVYVSDVLFITILRVEKKILQRRVFAVIFFVIQNQGTKFSLLVNDSLNLSYYLLHVISFKKLKFN